MDRAYHNQMVLFVGAVIVGLALPRRWILWLAVAAAIMVVGYGLLRVVSNPKDDAFETLILITAFPIVASMITTGGGIGMLLRWSASKYLNLTRLSSKSDGTREDFASHDAKVERETHDLF
jgi:hypothetical protein